jgi:hypothetical protein
MLIAQAMTHSLMIISQDQQFDAYAIQRVWACSSAVQLVLETLAPSLQAL